MTRDAVGAAPERNRGRRSKRVADLRAGEGAVAEVGVGPRVLEFRPAVMVLGGALLSTLLALLLWNLRGSVNFVDRDEGVITLAQARNWVEYGSIATGRFGDRVLGFDAPLQFLVALPYFALGGGSYQVFNRVVDFTAYAGVGALSGAVLSAELRTASSRIRGLALVAAVVLQAMSWSYFGWHFSGRENALTSVLVVAAVLMIPRVTSSRAAIVTGIILGLLSVSRLDAISLSAPLLLVALWALRSSRGDVLRRRVIMLVGPTAVAEVLLAVWLRAYFGTWTSTSAADRPRATVELIALGMSAVVIGLAGAGAVARSRRMPAADGSRSSAASGERRRPARWLMGAVAVGCVLVVATLLGGAGPIRSAFSTWSVTGGWWTAALLVGAWVSPILRPHRVAAFTVVLVWAPVYQAVFGASGIAAANVVSSAVPVLTVAAVTVVGRFAAYSEEARGRGDAPASMRYRRVRSTVFAGAALVPVLLLVGFLGSPTSSYARRYYLGSIVDPRPAVLLATVNASVSALNPAPVPIVVASDLGKLSFRGDAQIVDSGRVGDPLYREIVLRTTGKERTKLLRSYLLDVAAPDAWMVTSVGACVLEPIIGDVAFGERYRKVAVGAASNPEDGDLRAPVTCPNGPFVGGVWTLRNPAQRPDLVIASSLLGKRSKLTSTFFDPCRAGNLTGCFERVRGFRRAYPGVDGVDRARPLMTGLGSNPVGRLAVTLITAPTTPTWWTVAYSQLRQIVEARS